MELIERKRILNSKKSKLPGYLLGADATGENPLQAAQEASVDGAGAAASAAASAAGLGAAAGPIGLIMDAIMKAPKAVDDVVQSFNYDKSTGDLLNQVPQQEGSVGGVGYTKYGSVDVNKEVKDINRNTKLTALGSLASPLTTLGAGLSLLGGRHAKKKARQRAQEANRIASAITDYNRSGALTSSLQNNLAERFGDSNNQPLGAKNGKDKGVWTSAGKMFGVANGRVAKGEPIVDNIDNPKIATGSIVKDGKFGVDGPLAYLSETSVVLGNEKAPNGLTYAENGKKPTSALEDANKKQSKAKTQIARNTVDLQKRMSTQVLKDLAAQQKAQHIEEGYRPTIHAANGFEGLGIYDTGDVLDLISNVGTSLTGTMVGLKQYLDAKHSHPYRPNIYSGNKYEKMALDKLSKLRYNPYQAIQEMRNAEARTNYAINMSGGLSGAQKYLGRLSALNTTQQNIAKVYADSQNQNNAYASQYATKALEAGMQDAQRRMSAKEYADNYYAKSHAARQQGMQQGIQNMLANMNQFAANEFKRKNYAKTRNLYQQDLEYRRPTPNVYTENNYTPDFSPLTAYDPRSYIMSNGWDQNINPYLITPNLK